MPYTPFHFGPGLLAKAATPRWISFLAFAAANVAVDCEVAFNYLRGHHPHHGHVHTVAIGGPLGLVVGLLTVLALRSWFPRTVAAHPLLRADLTALGGAVGGFLGGASHALIDALMHRDARPFWPFSMSNPLLGLVPVWSIYVGCVIAGAAGYWILKARPGTPA